MKKFISLCLLLVLFCGILFLHPTQAEAYPNTYPLPIITGDMAQDVANIATSQLGYAYNDGTAYGAWWSTVTNWGYDYTRLDWCAMFACWCAYQAGAGMDVAYSLDGAKASLLFAWQKQNCFYDTTLTVAPKPGDFMYFGGSDRIPNHVAIVTSYDSESQTVYMVGGNQGDSPGSVTTTTCPWYPGAMRGSKYVLGFGRPNYSAGGCSPHQYAKGVYCPESDSAPAMNTYTCNLCGFVLEKPIGVKNGVCGENVRWNLTEDGTLTVYGTGAMMNYMLSDYSAPNSPFFMLSNVQKVVVKSGVTSVGDYAFFRQTALKTVVLPDSLTNIGEEAFGGCTALVTVNLPEQLNAIGKRAFNCCDSLTVLRIPHSVATIGEGAFLRCRSLTQVQVGFGVAVIEPSTFSGCFSLEEVTFYFGLQKIAAHAFSGCGQLQNIRYVGTENQWKATQVLSNNDRLKNATISYVQQGWIASGKNWYYFSSGKAFKGWLYYDSCWYYLDSTGKMVTGWQLVENRWYYLDGNGRMVTGWLKDGKTWYYLEASGRMATGWLKEGNSWYYLKPSGAMLTGWLQCGTAWYYLNHDGRMLTGSHTIGGKTYHFNGSGVCLN